jgi:hypothetical protein
MKILFAFSVLFVSATSAALAQNEPSIKNTASLSEYVSRVEALDGMVRDLSMTAAVSLLGQTYPEWTFERESGFDSYAAGVFPPITNDLGGIASEVENAFTYVRGKYVRNDAVSDAHRQEAVEIIGEVLHLVQTCREIDDLLADGMSQQAGTAFRSELVPTVDALTQRIRSLATELNQQIKFSAL